MPDFRGRKSGIGIECLLISTLNPDQLRLAVNQPDQNGRLVRILPSL
jgi:hypothetical protein